MSSALSPRFRSIRRIAVPLAAAAVATVSTGFTGVPTASAGTSCAAPTQLHLITATSGSRQQLLTPWQHEAAVATSGGAYTSTAIDWRASLTSGAGRVAVHRLYHPTRHDFLLTTSMTAFYFAKARGYKDEGVPFYAPDRSTACAPRAVYAAQSVRTGVHHYSTDAKALAAAGYTAPQPAFYVPATVVARTNVLGTPYLSKSTAAWAAYAKETNLVRKRDLYNIAATPTAIWLGGASTDGAGVRSIVQKAAAANQVPQFVFYAIPGRDCGSFAAGGSASENTYKAWVRSVVAGIGTHKAVVIVEPDAISFCGNNAAVRRMRTGLMSYAAQQLHDHAPNTAAYLHAGSGSLPMSYVVPALRDSGIRWLRGFALNVASLGTTAEQQTYGDQVAVQLQKSGIAQNHYVIDTSRNGAGRQPNPAAPWNSCNNPNAALGVRPTSATTGKYADAYLWVKRPGESDGRCHPGEPSTGWSSALALTLMANTKVRRTVPYLPLP